MNQPPTIQTLVLFLPTFMLDLVMWLALANGMWAEVTLCAVCVLGWDVLTGIPHSAYPSGNIQLIPRTFWAPVLYAIKHRLQRLWYIQCPLGSCSLQSVSSLRFHIWELEEKNLFYWNAEKCSPELTEVLSPLSKAWEGEDPEVVWSHRPHREGKFILFLLKGKIYWVTYANKEGG